MRRKAIVAVFGAVLCLGLLAGCSASEEADAPEAGESDVVSVEDGAATSEDNVQDDSQDGTQSEPNGDQGDQGDEQGGNSSDPEVVVDDFPYRATEVRGKLEGSVINTPFCTITIPDEYAENVEFGYHAEDYGLTQEDRWDDESALWHGHSFRVSLGGEAPKATFFFVVSRVNDEGKHVAVQGGFQVVKAGEYSVGDHTYAVSVCKGRNQDDPGDASGEVRAAIEKYASWVKVDFDPTRVDDEMLDAFLGTHFGQEWARLQ